MPILIEVNKLLKILYKQTIKTLVTKHHICQMDRYQLKWEQFLLIPMDYIKNSHLKIQLVLLQ